MITLHVEDTTKFIRFIVGHFDDEWQNSSLTDYISGVTYRTSKSLEIMFLDLVFLSHNSCEDYILYRLRFLVTKVISPCLLW